MKKKKCGKISLGLDLKRCNECEYRQKIRPCEVDGKICTFHRFTEEETMLIKMKSMTHPREYAELIAQVKEQGVVPALCDIEKVRATFALIEYPDGSVGKVDPAKVHFLDRKES